MTQLKFRNIVRYFERYHRYPQTFDSKQFYNVITESVIPKNKVKYRITFSKYIAFGLIMVSKKKKRAI